MSISMQEADSDREWRCQNPLCRRRFAEYVNGCPCCETGDPGGELA